LLYAVLPGSVSVLVVLVLVGVLCLDSGVLGWDKVDGSSLSVGLSCIVTKYDLLFCLVIWSIALAYQSLLLL
jgi:hypothetical protein